MISNHRYINTGVIDDIEADDDNNNTIRHTPVYTNDYQTNNKKSNQHNSSDSDQLHTLSIPFLKKYIEFAKQSYQPILTDDSTEYIAHAYTQLRNSDERKSRSALPVTARTLETMIRLSTAHGKARLSDEITVYDCESALNIMLYALTNDTQVVKKSTVRHDTLPVDASEHSVDEHKSDDADDSDDIDMVQSSAVKRARTTSTIDMHDSTSDTTTTTTSTSTSTIPLNLSLDRINLFKGLLSRYFMIHV